jgi:hypothetical protein
VDELDVLQEMISPHTITQEVEDFAEILTSRREVVQMKCRTQKTAVVNECFDAVADYIAIHGGERVLGWFIGEWPSVLLLAELHAVWKSDEGRWLDVARHPIPRARILFVPDSQVEIPKIQEPNRYHPLSDDPLVPQYIECEHSAHLAADPSSKYMNVLDPKLQEAQLHMLRYKAALAKKFGWPKGTPIQERMMSKIFL